MFRHHEALVATPISQPTRKIACLALFALLASGAVGCAEDDLELAAATSDDQIVSQVRAQIAREVPGQTGAIAISSVDGMVILDGQVATEADRQEIEDIAENVDGVEEVANHLRVVRASSGIAPGVGAAPPELPIREQPLD
jgi:hypothetical protein